MDFPILTARTNYIFKPQHHSSLQITYRSTDHFSALSLDCYDGIRQWHAAQAQHVVLYEAG